MDKLKDRLDMFSDAVIAILITIMVLELPIPSSDSFAQYLNLGKSIGIFFISFCFIANIWYQHSMLYKNIDRISNRVFIIEFIFLAFLSLTPTFTKMITLDTNRNTVMAYGILILIVNGLLMALSYAVAHLQYENSHDFKKVFFKIYFDHSNVLGLSNVFLLVLAYFQPTWALVFYLALPVISFIFNRNDYSDLEGINQLPESEQDKYVQLSNSDIRDLRRVQRGILQKYLRQRMDNPNWSSEMDDEMKALFKEKGLNVQDFKKVWQGRVQAQERGGRTVLQGRHDNQQ